MALNLVFIQKLYGIKQFSYFVITTNHMSLSSDSLIHFTKTKSALKGILENNFRVHYCLEKIETKGELFLEMAVPMVSFCDIPLSEVKLHIKRYGPYGLGLKKEWATANGLNPVLYVDKDSLVSSQVTYIYEKILGGKSTADTYKDRKQCSIMDINRYIKNYEGILERKGRSKRYRFADEKEWRYIPAIKKENGFLPIINFLNYNTINKRALANKDLENVYLSFNPNDIKYIIIKKESEIEDFIRILERAKGNKYVHDDIKRLTTRIITSEQINTDF